MAKPSIELVSSHILKVVLDIDAGANIGTAMLDAVRLSAEMNVNVEFAFNDKKYRVNFNDLLACCNPIVNG
jgi:hypothetical protein